MDFKIEIFPDKFSLSYTGRLADRPSLKSSIPMKKIKWVRARELYKNAKLVVNGGSRSDVNQGKLRHLYIQSTICLVILMMLFSGSLGDCWFLAAMSGSTPFLEQNKTSPFQTVKLFFSWLQSFQKT